MSLGLNHLCEKICSKTVGILWLTDEELDFQSYGLFEFNYLLDGILMNSLKDQTYEASKKANYFLGNSFGHPFFLGHVKISDKNDLKLIENHIQISDRFISEDCKIFIFNKSKNTANHNVLKTLQDKFDNIKFENLNI